MINLPRYYVCATEQSLLESGIQKATPVEFDPFTNEIRVLNEASGVLEWVVYATYKWYYESKLHPRIRIVQILDKDIEKLVSNGIRLSIECSKFIYTDEMRKEVNDAMKAITYHRA